MESVVERFLRYVTFDTQSDEESDTCPSTEKQKALAAALVEETRECLEDRTNGLYGLRCGCLCGTRSGLLGIDQRTHLVLLDLHFGFDRSCGFLCPISLFR